jgi:hypothetical protein
MARRHKRGFYDGRGRELDRRQAVADLVQAGIDREQRLVDSAQAQLTQRWVRAAMDLAAGDRADRVARAKLRRLTLDLVEDQRRHDLHQALIDQKQAAADAIQRVIDMLQAEFDDLTLAAAQAHAVLHGRGTRQRASVGRRRSRARNAGILASECI